MPPSPNLSVSSSGSPAFSPVEIECEQHRLGNGLRVLLHRDHRLPLVAINLWYHVGSKNEAPGRTGFAHLFEHMCFQGSEHVGTNDHFHLVQQAGGVANGSTWYDRTNYHEVLPSSHLDLGLWLEADRMGFLLPAITQEKLDNQREVVINERRQKMDNQPYGRAFERLHELLYAPNHPYRWPVIGYVKDLEQTTLEDVHDFFRTFYRPNNAVLTLAGDFDTQEALDRVHHYFGEIESGEDLAPLNPARPEVGELRREVIEDNVQLPRVYMGFHAPPFGEKGWYAADLLATALSDGKSSVLYEDLVYRRQLAKDVGCFVFPTESTATFSVVSTARPGVAPETLEAALREHLEDHRQRLVDPMHLERARNSLLISHFDQFQTLDRRADRLSMFATYLDDPIAMVREVERYRALEAEDLRDFARAYLELQVVVTVVPRSGEASS